MIRIRKAAERGHASHGWLDTYHTFSFGSYRDADHMGFRSLRVMNEDFIEPGEGFGTHPHHDMEIVTYVLEGELEHRDSMGHGEVLQAGEFQRMSAGSGITHSEFNPSGDQRVHLYQIWLLPERKAIEPSYQQKRFPEAQQHNRLRLVASPGGQDESLHIGQDARIYLATLDTRRRVFHPLAPRRHAWLQVLRGQVQLNGHVLDAGDGAAVSEETNLAMDANQRSEVMLFDLS